MEQSVVIKTIHENLGIQRIKNIVLFGSYAKGIASKNSDIDLYVETENEDFLAMCGWGYELREKLGRNVDLLLNEFMDIDDYIYNAIQSEGVTIYER